MSFSELSKTILQNDIEAVKQLLKNGVDFNSYRTKITDGDCEERVYALSDAIACGNAEIIGFLLARDPNLLLIHKELGFTVKIDFYARPVVLEFKYNDVKTYMDINGKFICGSRGDNARFIKWLADVENELDSIIWEWETGNDDFELISMNL